jgi:hypothetical protein
MITIFYSILIYILTGSIIYLMAQNHQFKGKELTYPKMIFYGISDIVFKPIINTIEILDNFKIYIWTRKQYKVILNDKSLTREQRQGVIDEKDEIINFLSNLCYEDDQDEK